MIHTSNQVYPSVMVVTLAMMEMVSDSPALAWPRLVAGACRAAARLTCALGALEFFAKLESNIQAA